jgi:hypothetical protein
LAPEFENACCRLVEFLWHRRARLTIHPILTRSNRVNLMLDKPPLIVSTQYQIDRFASSLEADITPDFRSQELPDTLRQPALD